jgi:hypothetical protein
MGKERTSCRSEEIQISLTPAAITAISQRIADARAKCWAEANALVAQMRP